MSRPASFLRLLPIVAVTFSPLAFAQFSELDQIQIAPPMRQIQPPSQDASVKELERTGDELRARKAYLDAIDYYQVAQKKAPDDAALYNKIGISQLMLQRYRDAGRSFEEAIKKDHRFSDAYNNLGVVQYERRKYRAAIKQYKKAMEIAPDMASFYSNLGAAYFAKKKFEDASRSYARALELILPSSSTVPAPVSQRKWPPPKTAPTTTTSWLGSTLKSTTPSILCSICARRLRTATKA